MSGHRWWKAASGGVIAATAAVLTVGHAGGAHHPDLPDRALTPGAVDPAVTQANIGQTICVRGYTATVRNVPYAERRAVFAAYHLSYSRHRDYEVDHLISLELGGSNEQTNLWPEYGPVPNPKDRVENRLHELVCSGRLPLAVAQQAIASNWKQAADKYGG